MARPKPAAPPDKAWKVFAGLHRGNPFLAEDPLHALTADVIDAIQKHVPGFFSEKQERFERDLARMTGAGFFLRHPLGKPASLIDEPGLTIGEFVTRATSRFPTADDAIKRLTPALKPEWFTDGQRREAISAIYSFIQMLWAQDGRPEKAIQAARHQEQGEAQTIVRLGEAYAGWLILNKEFRTELRYLQRRWSTSIAEQGGFPRRNDQDPARRIARRGKCAAACFAFYQRWCLDRMLTWDLPAPLDTQLHYGACGGREMTDDEGVTLAVPWHLLKGDTFDLQEVIRRIRFEAAPRHLRQWICRGPGRKDDQAGSTSYQRLYSLYRCYELVLFRRYRGSCHKNMEKLDRAVGEVMGREEDLVKRLRQHLTRKLRDS